MGVYEVSDEPPSTTSIGCSSGEEDETSLPVTTTTTLVGRILLGKNAQDISFMEYSFLYIRNRVLSCLFLRRRNHPIHRYLYPLAGWVGKLLVVRLERLKCIREG